MNIREAAGRRKIAREMSSMYGHVIRANRNSFANIGRNIEIDENDRKVELLPPMVI